MLALWWNEGWSFKISISSGRCSVTMPFLALMVDIVRQNARGKENGKGCTRESQVTKKTKTRASQSCIRRPVNRPQLRFNRIVPWYDDTRKESEASIISIVKWASKIISPCFIARLSSQYSNNFNIQYVYYISLPYFFIFFLYLFILLLYFLYSFPVN